MKYPVTLTDVQNQETVFSGMADVMPISNGYSVRMETDDFISTWNIYRKGCIIENQAEATVRLVLKSGSGGFAKVTTDYGTLSLPAVLDQLDSTNQRCEVRYRLGEEHEPFHFLMTIDQP